MAKAIKAALLSGLLFPGLGHFYLKKRKTGAVLALAALAGLYLGLADLFDQAMGLAEKVESGEIPMNVAAISEAIASQPPDPNAWLVTLAWYAFFFAWVIGIADSFRVGYREDHTIPRQPEN